MECARGSRHDKETQLSKVQSRLPPYLTSPAGYVPSMSVCVRPSLSLVVDAWVKRELGITMEVDEGSAPDEQAVGDQIFADMKDEVLDLHVKTESAVQDGVPFSQQGSVQCYREFEAFTDANGGVRDLHGNRGFDANMFVEKDVDQSLSNLCVEGRVFRNVMVSEQREFVPFREDYANVDETVMDLHVNRSVAEDVYMNRVAVDSFPDRIKVEDIDGITSAGRDVVEFHANQTVDEATNNGVLLPIVHRNYWEVEGLGRITSMNQGINHVSHDVMGVNHARRVQVDQNVVVVKQETQVRIQDAIQEIHKILMIQSKEVPQPNHIPMTYVFTFCLIAHKIILFVFLASLYTMSCLSRHHYGTLTRYHQMSTDRDH